MMNQRIKELYEQAHRVYEVPYEGSVVDPTIVAYHKHKVFDRDLFAELIIKECVRVAINTNLEDVEGGDSDVLYAAHTQIKEHFGVE